MEDRDPTNARTRLGHRLGVVLGSVFCVMSCASRDATDALAATEAQVQAEATEEEESLPDSAPGERWDADFDQEAGVADSLDRARDNRFAPPPPDVDRKENSDRNSDWWGDGAGDRESGRAKRPGGGAAGRGVTLGGSLGGVGGEAVAWRSADDALAELQGLEHRLAAAGVSMPTVALGSTATTTTDLPSAPPGVLEGDEDASGKSDKSETKRPAAKQRKGKGGAKNKKKSTRASKPSADPQQPVDSPTEAPPSSGEKNEEQRQQVPWCTNVCELTSAICTLELRICDMATRYPDDERYAGACERARLDCRVATDACNACSAQE